MNGLTLFPLRRTVVWPVAATLPLLSLVALAQGLPTGGRVTAGQAAIESPGTASTVVRQTTPKAVVRWTDFSIGAGRSVVFVQPNAAASTLNIVDGGKGSTIAGHLRANGSVLLINPSGVAITPTGKVDTQAGFIASTLAITDDDYLAGRLLFTGKGAGVVNAGEITTGVGGFVGMLGSTVRNDGVIRAPLGRVMLGAAQKATLDLSGDGYLQVLLPADAAQGEALVSNAGNIQADGGTVMLKAATVREALREAVHMPGEIRARSVSGRDGAVVLDAGSGSVQVTGMIDASADAGASRGGRIDVTGDSVALKGATLLATGPESGGLVRIGGEFQGGRAQAAGSTDAERFSGRFGAVPALANAATTQIDAASTIDVSSAQGTGGTAVVWSNQNTTMAGRLDATGATVGGAVEISSQSTIQSVNLARVTPGRGGKLLLDPQNILINGSGTDPAASYDFAANPGGLTHIGESDLKTLLTAGTSVDLQASNDITWSNAFFFLTGTTNGHLKMEAGRSVTLSGAFTTANGNWTLIANSSNPAVVPAERQAGDGNVDMRNASFVNNNGIFVLQVQDGGGRNGREIAIGTFQGNSLTASIAPGVTSEFPTPTVIQLNGDIDVATNVSLTGNLRVGGPNRTIKGASVTWTNEKTGGTVSGEGTIKFMEGTTVTRFGNLGFGTDATRVQLGNPALTSVTREYGDAEPDPASLGVPPVQIAAHSATAPAPALTGVVPAGALAFSGPGVTAPVGGNTLTLGATAGFSIAAGFFADLTPVTVPLTVTPRTLTANALNPSYTYGSPTAAVSLSGLVNGDQPVPVATLNGAAGVTLDAIGGDFAFAARTPAGNSSFTVTGLSGSTAGNYTLVGATGTLTIAPKPVNFTVGAGGQTYGTQQSPTMSLSGIVPGDSIDVATALSTQGPAPAPVTHTARLPVGSYGATVTGIGGADGGNYVLAPSGNTNGTFTVAPKPINFQVPQTNSTYGTLAADPAGVLVGVLSGDDVSPVLTTEQNGSPVTLAARTPVGTYFRSVSGITGGGVGNYTLAPAGNSGNFLFIDPKTLTAIGSSSTQGYGLMALPTYGLTGVEAGDDVQAAFNTSSNTIGSVGGSGALAAGTYTTSVGGVLFGAASGNYTLAPTGNTPQVVTITPRTITWHAGASTSTYGTAASVPNATLGSAAAGDAIVAGDTISSFMLIDGNGSVTPSLPRGSYPVTVGQLTGAGADNYVIAASGNTPGTHTVNPKAITWQVGNGSAVYGNALTNTPTLNGLFGADAVTAGLNVVSGGSVVPRPGAGTHSVEVTSISGTAANNYTLAPTGNTPGSLVVTPRPLTYSIVNTNSVYGTLATTGAVTLAGKVAGDADPTPTVGVFSGVTPVTLAARTGAGTYAARVTALSDPNYMLATAGNVDGTVLIAPKTVRFTTTNASSTYGTAAVVAPATLNSGDILLGDTVGAGATIVQGGTVPGAQQPAGTYALVPGSLTGAQGGNYLATATGSTLGALTVGPKEITYALGLRFSNTVLGDSRNYGELFNIQPTVDVALTGLVGADSVTLGVNAPTIPLSTSGFWAAGVYTFTGSNLNGPAAGNYVLATTGNSDRTFTVNKIPLVVAPGALDPRGFFVSQAEYGSTAGLTIHASVQPRSQDRVTADAVFSIPAGNVSTLPERLPVGSYSVLFTGLSGPDAGNYTADIRGSGALSVVPKPLSGSLTNGSSVYGNTPGFGSPTLQGVLAGDDITATIQASNNRGALDLTSARLPAGTYGIRITGLNGSSASNYTLLPSTSALFTVFRRPLGLNFDASTLTQTYGGFVDSKPTVNGVLSGDEVTVTAMARPIAVVAGGNGLRAATSLLDAGTYDYFGQLGGSAGGNYELPGSSGTITINRKPVTATIGARTTTYGTLAPAQTTLTGILSGQTVDAVVGVTNSANATTTYTERTDAGSYTTRVTGLAGATAPNYDLQNAGVSSALTISPKALTLSTQSAGFSTTYGSPATLGTLGGVLFGDDVGINLARGNGTAARATLNSSGAVVVNDRLDAGTYTFRAPAGTVGPKAGNYTFANAVDSVLRVDQKTLLYTVDSVSGQYGNFKACETATCNPWTPGITLGQAHFQGVLSGDTVGGTVGLLDFKGEAGTLTAQTPVGQYFEVVTGLTGASASNYRLATSGSLPGVLTITPVWVTYQTTSGVYLPASGLVGYPGIPTLRAGGTAGLLNGDAVAGVVRATDPAGATVTDLSKLVPGTYSFFVTGLTGPQAGNYRLRPNYTVSDTGAYTINDVGTLEVFATANLGLDFTKPIAVPKPPAITPPVPQVSAPDLAATAKDKLDAGLPTFGRNIDATGTDFQATAGMTGAGASGAAGGVATADIDVAGGNLSAQASGYVDALAKVGVTGVTLEANANAHVDVTFKVGAGFVMVGAQADAQSEVQVGREGAQVSAEARAGTYASGGASGSLGSAGSGSVTATTGVFVFAKADNEYTFKDGKIVAKLDESIGVGVSAGTQAGISGRNGSVDAGVTVYSPGSVGGAVNWAAGYKDGTISIGLDLGIKALLGGLEVNLAFSVNVNEMAKTIATSDAARAVSTLFGVNFDDKPRTPAPYKALETAVTMTKDPAGRFAYMQTNSEWANYTENHSGSTTALTAAYRSNKAFYESYQKLLTDTAQLVKAQNDAQATFMALLKTDPKAAIEMSHSGTFKQLRKQENLLSYNASRIGVKLSVASGKLAYVNKP